MSGTAKFLEERIRSEGPIPFAEVMAEALYGEDGYYTGAVSPIGAQGDYVTGSSLSPLFAQSTAQVLRRLDRVLETEADLLEVGYGDGRHLAGVIDGLGGAKGRRILAYDRVSREVPAGVERLAHLTLPPQDRVRGLLFSYELFDALPVNRLIVRSDGTLGELWVDLDAAGNLTYVEGPLSDAELHDALGSGGEPLARGQIADIAPGWASLYRRMAGLLEVGLLVTCDYGFDRQRLFDPRVRFHGTLACYRSQRVHRDALRDLGNQDLTAHVDFSTLREVGEEQGLESVAFTRQARWLLACGLFDRIPTDDQASRLQAIDLLNPEGMGEEIRVLVQTRGVEAERLLDLELLGG